VQGKSSVHDDRRQSSSRYVVAVDQRRATIGACCSMLLNVSRSARLVARAYLSRRAIYQAYQRRIVTPRFPPPRGFPFFGARAPLAFPEFVDSADSSGSAGGTEEKMRKTKGGTAKEMKKKAEEEEEKGEEEEEEEVDDEEEEEEDGI